MVVLIVAIIGERSKLAFISAYEVDIPLVMNKSRRPGIF
jgi:hypothetical protein